MKGEHAGDFILFGYQDKCSFASSKIGQIGPEITGGLSRFFLSVPQAGSHDAVAPFTAFTHSCRPVSIWRNAMLFATVRRGKKAGVRLVPHRYEDDRYHVCLGKKGPYIPLADEFDIPDYLANGYSLGMSGGFEKNNPRLIRPGSIWGWK